VRNRNRSPRDGRSDLAAEQRRFGNWARWAHHRDPTIGDPPQRARQGVWLPIIFCIVVIFAALICVHGTLHVWKISQTFFVEAFA